MAELRRADWANSAIGRSSTGERGRRVVVRSNRDIGLNTDTQGLVLEIIAQERALGGTSTPLIWRLRAIHVRLHLHILEVRRARARLGDPVRVAAVGVDVVRRLAVLGAVLQLDGREEAADDR